MSEAMDQVVTKQRKVSHEIVVDSMIQGMPEAYIKFLRPRLLTLMETEGEAQTRKYLESKTSEWAEITGKRYYVDADGLLMPDLGVAMAA